MLFALLLFASFGCVDTSRVSKPAKPKTPDAAVTPITQPANIEQAASQFFIEYSQLAATAADETARKCAAGEFADITAADDFFAEQTKAARLKVNETFATEMTRALDDSKGKKASSVENVYKSVASGFRKITKK
jgi:hypothetical protein